MIGSRSKFHSHSDDTSSKEEFQTAESLKMNQAKLPAAKELSDKDVFSFLFSLSRDQLAPTSIQKMLFADQIKAQVQQMALQQREAHKKIEAQPHSREMVSPVSSTMQIKHENSSLPFDFSACSKKFLLNFEKLIQSETNDVKAEKISSFPLSEAEISTSLKTVVFTNKISKWIGSNVYNNIPLAAQPEYDKLLQESHELKLNVVNILNAEYPVSYDYNPKKSRIRTNYADPQIADDRTRNNIASRRSRQRKKFHHQVLQYSVDFDIDEKEIMTKEIGWLLGLADNMESRLIDAEGDLPRAVTKIKNIRKDCGLI